MDTLQSLAIALGLASLAGLNLYLTVFVTGLAIQQQWINIAHTHPDLAVLGHPAIIAVAGALYFLEFFADKVPWVDSLWDTVHTAIRPIGGAFIAIRVLGQPDPVFDVIVALLGGSVALIVHSAKAGTRLIANHSPEPFSNIALSVTEDAAVLGGLALVQYAYIHNDPWLLLSIFGTIILCILYFGPKLFRAAKVNAYLLWKKLTSPAADQLDTELPKTLPHELEIACHSANVLGERIVWAVPCICSSAKKVPANLFGYLIATEGDPTRLVFVARRRWSKAAQELDLKTYKLAHEPKFLSENIVLYSLEKKPKFVFLFARSQRAVVKEVATSLKQRLETPTTSVAAAELEEVAPIA